MPYSSDSHSMGIQGLAKLIADVSAAAIKEGEIKNYFGTNTVLLLCKFISKKIKFFNDLLILASRHSCVIIIKSQIYGYLS